MSAPDLEQRHAAREDPEDEIELAGLIETLRAAAPPREALAPLRSRLVRAPVRVRAPRALQAAAAIAVVLATGMLARQPEASVATVPASVSATSIEASLATEPGSESATSIEAPRATPAPVLGGPSIVAATDVVPPPVPIEIAALIPERPVPEPEPIDPEPARFVETAGLFPPIDERELDAFVGQLAAQAPPRTTLAVEEPSPLLARALRDAAESRCEEAAIALQRVAEGETVDASEHVQQAELALARCLLRMGYPNAALSVLDAISRAGVTHSRRLEALDPLAQIGERLPDPRGVIEALGRYSEPDLAQAPRERRSNLAYMMARARYEEADFEAAARLFASVPEGDRWYVPARYLEGVAHVRRHRARPAFAAFQAVIDAVGTDRDGGGGERQRFRDLAYLALARVQYTAAAPGTDRDPARQQRLLESALAAWQRVPFGSEAGLDAFFEESWALYVLGEHARALGHVHGLLAPQLRDRPRPESLVLRATIYFEHCRYDAAEAVATEFHQRYDSLLAAIDTQEPAVADTDAAYALLDDVRSGRTPSGMIGQVLRSAFDDREIARMLVQVRALDAEIARIRAASRELRESTLGIRIEQELATSRSLAVETAAEAVRLRLRRIGDELRDRSNEIDAVHLEITTARRDALVSDRPLTSEPERPVPIVAVQGDQVWPFDGEYWEDELPRYREHVTSICAR